MGVQGPLEGDRGSFLGPRAPRGGSRTFFGFRGLPELGRRPQSGVLPVFTQASLLMYNI